MSSSSRIGVFLATTRSVSCATNVLMLQLISELLPSRYQFLRKHILCQLSPRCIGTNNVLTIQTMRFYSVSQRLCKRRPIIRIGRGLRKPLASSPAASDTSNKQSIKFGHGLQAHLLKGPLSCLFRYYAHWRLAFPKLLCFHHPS